MRNTVLGQADIQLCSLSCNLRVLVTNLQLCACTCWEVLIMATRIYQWFQKTIVIPATNAVSEISASVVQRLAELVNDDEASSFQGSHLSSLMIHHIHR